MEKGFFNMHKLGEGCITTEKDVDQLIFDWGKIHFLSDEKVFLVIELKLLTFTKLYNFQNFRV